MSTHLLNNSFHMVFASYFCLYFYIDTVLNKAIYWIYILTEMIFMILF